MKRICVQIALVVFSLAGSQHTFADEALTQTSKIIVARSGQIPQAPRISPDGTQMVFEYYSKQKTSLWHSSVDGKTQTCLTCDQALSLEDGYWHPSGRYLVFNEVPAGSLKQNGIYTATIQNGKLGPLSRITSGARPQFSRPNGSVIFFEASQLIENRMHNVLAYQILGNDPLHPAEERSLELRGPIQKINRVAEISHPSLAPDGTTIVFAARAINLKSNTENGVMLTDIDRQKIYKLWTELWPVSNDAINAELRTLHAEQYDTIVPRVGNNDELAEIEFSTVMDFMEKELAKPTIVPGYTKRHLYLAWVLGILNHRDKAHDLEVQELIFPRLWVTDVFGAPVTPLVKDISSTPLPQKWATVSRDGSFAVFEAGHYSDRHIYLAVKKNGTWLDRAIRITEKGTYNSSPELDPTGEWLYFESNRDGSKGIWRAKLNWPEINRQLGL